MGTGRIDIRGKVRGKREAESGGAAASPKPPPTCSDAAMGRFRYSVDDQRRRRARGAFFLASGRFAAAKIYE